MANNAVIVGAGIVGLATAKALAELGWKVTVYEKSDFSVGASIRNFGMVWPIGQPSGKLYDRATRSRSIWKDVCISTNSWFEEAGSLHVAQSVLEVEVMKEIVGAYEHERKIHWVEKDQLKTNFPNVNTQNALGAIWSEEEVIVESRNVIRSLPAFLEREYGVEFKFNQLVTEAYSGFVMVGSKRVDTDMVCICSGADLELLFPHVYAQHLTKCKLQMLRLVAQQSNHRFGPAICGGLSLIHYKSFGVAQSLPLLKEVYELEYPAYIAHGIHVMACQNHLGELTVGDSHEYGKDFDPFDKAAINELILDFLKKIAIIDDWRVIQTWNGVYPKMTNGATELVQEVDKDVWVINGLGGAGMTLSFGLAEEFAKQFA